MKRKVCRALAVAFLLTALLASNVQISLGQGESGKKPLKARGGDFQKSGGEYWSIFPWYDCQGMQTWILVANPGPVTIHIDLSIGSMQKETDYPISPGGRQYFKYDGVMDGPVKIISTDGSFFATQRSIYGTSFCEVAGSKYFALTYYFPWYDCQWMKTWILVANPYIAFPATIDLYIGSTKKEKNYIIPGGGRAYFKYDGVMDGPVKVVSKDTPIIATQRSIYASSFCEVKGISQNKLTTTYYFPWYDCQGMQTWVLVGNPSTTSTAYVDLFIGSAQKENDYAIAPGGRKYFKYDGVMDGPVKVTSDKPVFATQRSLYGPSFCEVMGIPANNLWTYYYFPWYDCQGMQTWVLVGNPSTTSTARIDLFIGSTQKESSYRIPIGGRAYFKYDGVMDGPVKVISNNGVPIIATQRSLYPNVGSTSFWEIGGLTW